MIDAAGLGDRVIVIGPGSSVTLSGLTLTGGHAPDGSAGSAGAFGAGGPSGGGGGLGSSGGPGGAIEDAGTLTVRGAAVDGYRAGSGGTGGRGGDTDLASGGSGGNGGSGAGGGGILNTGSLTLTDATISSNHAGNGGDGGDGGDGWGGNGGLGGTGGNAGSGGGVDNEGGSLSVIATTITGNVAGGGGAGGHGGVVPNGPGNAGGGGGGGGFGGGATSLNGELSITNSTSAANLAGSGGGSGGSGGDGGVAGNSGAPGAAAGIVSASQAVLQDTLIASNFGGNCSGAITDGGRNLSFGDTGCPSTFATGDPRLGALRDNGGPTKTIALGAGSAAIDQGAACPQTDQRGVPRPSGLACDIGAYEVAPPAVSTGSANPVRTTGASIAGSVTPNSGDASVHFDYGTSRAYDLQTAVQHIGGVSPNQVTASLAGLKPGTTYHFRTVASTIDGTQAGADATFTTGVVTAPPRAPATERTTR